MNTFGFERAASPAAPAARHRWQRAEQVRARIGLRAPLIVLSAGVVFLCCFGLGRLTHTRAAAHVESPASLPVESSSGAAALRVGGAPAIETTLVAPVRVAPRPKPQPAAPPREVSPLQPRSAEPTRVTETPAQTSSPPPSAPAPAEPAPPAASPAPAPTHSSSPPPSAGGPSHSSGSFESSG